MIPFISNAELFELVPDKPTPAREILEDVFKAGYRLRMSGRANQAEKMKRGNGTPRALAHLLKNLPAVSCKKISASNDMKYYSRE